MSPVLGNSKLSLAFIITVLVSTVLHTSVSQCSLNFECPRLGYGFLLIIFGAWKMQFGSLKVLEFCTFSLLRTLTVPVLLAYFRSLFQSSNAVEVKDIISLFPVLQGSAETQIGWGGKLYHLSVPTFCKTFLPRMHFNPTTRAQVTATNVAICFYETQVYICALMLLVGWQEGHPACKQTVWRGYQSGARCRLAYGPADATATHCLSLQ